MNHKGFRAALHSTQCRADFRVGNVGVHGARPETVCSRGGFETRPYDVRRKR